jgi:hypothetical protein
MKRENAAKRYYKKNMIIMIAVFAPLVLLSYLLPLSFIISRGPDYAILWMFSIIMTIVPLPFIVYYVWQFVHYANACFIDIQTVEVLDCDTIQRGRFGPVIGFFVRVQHKGKTVTVCTKHVHQRADGYIGSRVEVGYNPRRKEWIVLE